MRIEGSYNVAADKMSFVARNILKELKEARRSIGLSHSSPTLFVQTVVSKLAEPA